MRNFVEQTLAELAAKAEIESRKVTMMAADPSHRVIDRNTLHETHQVAAATGEAIRAMIREVCTRFEVLPTELGYLVAY